MEKKIKCPSCNSSRITRSRLGIVCQKCGYRNDPRYLDKELNKEEKKDGN